LFILDNEFERNAKMWTRENVSILQCFVYEILMFCFLFVQCDRQFPHRKAHPSDHYFPDEGMHIMQYIHVGSVEYARRIQDES
jgi:hypothetical protein